MSANGHIDRSRISDLPRKLLRRGSRFNPDVFLVEWQGRPAVLKDYACIPQGPARAWGRWILRRQIELMKRAEGIAGVPAFVARVGSDAFLMECLPGRRVSDLRDESPPPEFFDRLAGLTDELHERGLSHGDIHRDHVLIDDRDRPSLVDFELAIMPRAGWRRPLAFVLFRLGIWTDRFQVARMKAHYHPSRLRDEERELLSSPPWYVKLALVYRGKWRRI